MKKSFETPQALKLQLCDIQGRLFKLSAKSNLGSAAFVRFFMKSKTAKELDSDYNRTQWAGEEYLLEEIIDASENSLEGKGEIFPVDVLYWIGYIYRYWHYYTGESSAQIYKQAPVEVVRRNYLMFHTMDPTLAIDDLKEIYKQKH